jgi:hypothetical protein
MPAIPALRSLRKDIEVEASLRYMVRPDLKQLQIRNNK